MIIQLLNIASGFVLASPKLNTFAPTADKVAVAHAWLAPKAQALGVLTLVLGLIALLERMGILFVYIPHLGASYPQALPAIATGLMLAAPLLKKYPQLDKLIASLERYPIEIGIASIMVGLGSLLFGCVLCIY